MTDWVYIYCLLLPAMLVLAYAFPQILVPFIIRRASDWGAIDLPDERKAHKNPTPRLGGMSLIPTLWISCSTILILLGASVFTEHGKTGSAVLGLLIGSGGVFFLGMLDDLKRLSPSKKLLVQVFAALFAVSFLPIPETILGIGAHPLVVKFLFLGWIVFLMNSVNLLDGVDGLTSALMLLFLSVLSILAALRGDYIWFLLLAPMGVSIFSFLRFNWNPAKIFLGDSGSLLLGFSVAYLSLFFATQPSPQGGLNWNVAISLSLTIVWLADTLLAIARRYLRKRPKLKILLRRSKVTYLALHTAAVRSVVYPDKGHIHHRLLGLGMTSQQVVMSLLVFGFMTMTISILATAPKNSFVQSSLLDSRFLLWPMALMFFSFALFLSCAIWYSIGRSLGRREEEQKPSKRMAA